MSALRERLGRLRGEAAPAAVAPAPPAAEPPEQPSLVERLRRLGGARTGQPPAARAPGAPASAAARDAPRLDEAVLAAALGAEQLAPGVLCRRRRLPLAQRHGNAARHPDPDAVRLLLPDAPPDPDGWCVIDTETSGLAGGTGTWVFMVGIARWEGAVLALSQLLLTRLDAEAAFLDHLRAAVADAELLLSYNGKSFDLPLLAARLRLAARPDPLVRLAHLDLLHPVRRAFATRWPDCRLASVEARLLGHVRHGDLPGAEAPAAWLAWLRAGDGRRLGAVLAHNAVDLLSVAALPARLAAVHASPTDFGADPARIARWWLAAGDAERARGVLGAADPAVRDTEAAHLLAELHARAADWPAALALWEPLAVAGDAAAHEALAKHYEHRAKDLRRALAHARRLPPGAAAERRCKRLTYKLGREMRRSDGGH
ncbi:ribonuclease H-like domain-containing protein [Thiohalocapsa sp. ML1]|uniref:ribonuclease H-like domain-containing protein n=1 Tax=Thiohalocapsa sp. ML1 TaxID=1431688 RepID=UPI00073243C7|nr:ribonuclease H-like domain-containing protein [Thiohalocapsa sp. ML1]